jgi:hypothetical protein
VAQTVSPQKSLPFVRHRTPARVLVAVALSALIDSLVWAARSTHLSGHIDIVGYPSFANFDYLPSFLRYRLATYAFPIGVIVIYWLLDRWGPLRSVDRRTASATVPLVVADDAAAEAAASAAPTAPALALARLIPAAVFVALATRTRVPVSLGDVTRMRIAAAAAYIVGVAAVSWVTLVVARRRPNSAWSYGDCVSAVNAFAGAAVAIGGLWFVSHQTEVLLPSHAIRAWPWIPWWLAVLGILAAWAWATRGLRSGRAPSDIEQRLRVVLLGSAAIYVIVAAIPAQLTGFNGFDDAQGMTGAALVQHGYFPWRDFQFIHGLFTDVFESWLGFHIFQPTAWGNAAGFDLVLFPLAWVGVYLLGAWAARRGSLLVLGPILLAAWGGLSLDPRFIAIAPVLILMGKSFTSRRLAWTAGLTVALFVDAIVVPESSYQVIGVLAVVVLSDLVHRRPGERLLIALRRSRCVVLTGAILTFVWAGFLASQHALKGFIDYYLIFGPGHDASGALPDSGLVGVYRVMFALMIVLVVTTILAAAWRIHRRATMSPRSWVTLAAAITAGLYGEQALGRPDLGHVELSLDMALPLFVLSLATVVPAVEDWLATGVVRLAAGVRRWRRVDQVRGRPGWRPQPAALLCLVVALLGVQSIPVNIWHAPRRTRARLGALTPDSPLGYASPGSLPHGLLTDLRTVVATYSQRNTPFFDMTNSPGWFYYLLGLRPASMFTNISQAIPESAQKLLISDLRRSRPRLIAFNDSIVGLPSWDGIANNVRHFQVSQYVLDHWTPVLGVDSFLFLLRNDLIGSRPPVPHLSQTPVTTDLYASQSACDWGYAANFLDSTPTGRSVTLRARPIRQGRTVSVRGWSFDPVARRPAREVVVARGERAVAVLPVNGGRPDVAAALRTARATATGYAGSFLAANPDGIRVYALTSDYKLHLLLSYGERAGPSPVGVIRMPNGSRIRVGTVGTGSVDGLTTSPTTTRISMFSAPRSTALPSVSLVTIGANRSIGTSQLAISDLPGVSTTPSNSEITAGTLPVTGSRIAVRVGSCLQWHGYRGRDLYVAQQGGAAITSMTLSDVTG